MGLTRGNEREYGRLDDDWDDHDVSSFQSGPTMS